MQSLFVNNLPDDPLEAAQTIDEQVRARRCKRLSRWMRAGWRNLKVTNADAPKTASS